MKKFIVSYLATNEPVIRFFDSKEEVENWLLVIRGHKEYSEIFVGQGKYLVED